MSSFLHFQTMSSHLDNQYHQNYHSLHQGYTALHKKGGPLLPIPEESPEDLVRELRCQGDRWQNVIAKGLPCMPKRSRSVGNKEQRDEDPMRGCGDSASFSDSSISDQCFFEEDEGDQ